MNIKLHIERLVLDGLRMAPHDSAQVQAAVEAELVRLLSESGIPAGLQAGFSQARIPAPVVQLNSLPHAREIGAQVSKGIYGAFAGLSQKG
jgi:hypothetical protein